MSSDSRTRLNLRAVAPLLLLAILIGTAVAGAAYLAYDRYSSERSSRLDDVRSENADQARQFEQFYDSRFETLEAIAASPIVASGDREAIKAYFERLVAAGSSFSGGLSIIGTDGIMVLLSGFPLDEPPIDLSDRDYVQAVLATDAPASGNAIVGRRSGDPLVTFAVPIRDGSDATTGILAGTLRLDAEGGGLARIGLSTDDVIVLDGANQVVMNRGFVETVEPADDALVELSGDSNELRTGVELPGQDGESVVSSTAIGDSGWHLLTVKDQGDVLGGIRRDLGLQLALLGALALMSAVALAALAWQRMTDIRVREQAADLQKSDEALRESLAAKESFISLVSHELRTPLTMILGNASLLAERSEMLSEDERRGALEDLTAESLRMERIVQNLLTLARLESARPDGEAVSVGAVVRRAIDELRRLYPNREVKPPTPGVELLVFADEGHVEQIVTNYIVNAVKYSPATAPVEIELIQRGRFGTIRVLDRGPGLAAHEIERVFEPFFRSSSTAGSAAGMGIGLSVCKRIADFWGGRCWAENRDGGGAVFAVELPLFVEEPLADDEASVEARASSLTPVGP